jgi:aminoglycoside phosphotransferase (APT) family kinase protein
VSSGTAELAGQLGKALGGRVASVRRLSGGASRLTSAFELETEAGAVRRLILQQVRGDGLSERSGTDVEANLLRAAAAAGVPVPGVVAAGAADGLPSGWLVVERLEGETIPRRIFGDEFAGARAALTDQAATALAAIHTIDPASVHGLPGADPLRHPLEFLDALGAARPVLELGVRWLDHHRPHMGRPVVVHGDFRMGNLLIDDTGLRGVLDWELAHLGDPAEDIGWLCARSWRFGGRGRVGGFGELDAFLDTYTAAGGEPVDHERVRWWEAYATIKWAVICLLQASAHLSGATRSVELAAIGRRVCESEWDLLDLMGVDRPQEDGTSHEDGPGTVPVTSTVFGRPTVAELVEAVTEYLEASVMPQTEGAARFEARVARNVLAIVGRELALAPGAVAAHSERLRRLGAADDGDLAAGIRAGNYDKDLLGVATLLADGVRDQLLVANPPYLGELQ